MSYNSTAYIYVTNNFSGNADIKLSHAYSDDSPVTSEWKDVAPGDGKLLAFQRPRDLD